MYVFVFACFIVSLCVCVCVSVCLLVPTVGRVRLKSEGRKASGSHNNGQSGEMYPVRVLDTFRLTDYW